MHSQNGFRIPAPRSRSAPAILTLVWAQIDPGGAPFQAHVELLRLFLAHREDIVESIEAVLIGQGKPIRYLQDPSLLSQRRKRAFEYRVP